ncbi:MAG: hypothetical protein U0235_07415 [Polyangiaceae bacterium]
MDYEAFAALAEKPSGMTAPGAPGPLYFGARDELIELIGAFSVMGDFLRDQGMRSFARDFSAKFPSYRVLAVLDEAPLLAADPDRQYDSYDEWFLVVDAAKREAPVLLWTGRGRFTEIAASFEAFHASLGPWAPDE